MNLKRTLIVTAVWLALVVAACICGIQHLLSQNLPNAQLQERTELFGGGVAVLFSIGGTIIWLPISVRFREERLGRR